MHVAPEPSARFPANWYPPDSDVTYTTAPDTDAPYTATMVTESLPGEGIRAFRQEGLQAKDGAGRERTETPRPWRGPNGTVIQVRDIGVDDPVSHCGFHWSEPVVSGSKGLATVQCNSRTLRYAQGGFGADFMKPPPPDETEGDELVHTEFLPEQRIEGFRTLGLRKTSTNLKTKAQQTTELLYSPELKEIMALRGAGIGYLHLTRIHVGEPDAGLFYPPAGYSIVPSGR